MPDERPLTGLARLFLKLGLIAFGGPAAHIAMLEDEVVTRRGWMDRQHFLDLVGATNLIPGPNSTEMTMHIGFERAGWKGLIIAGGSFILPAAVLTALAAWVYVTYGQLPDVAPFLIGIKPVVVVLILAAVWKLGRKAVQDWKTGSLATLVCISVLLGVGEVTALLVGGIAGMFMVQAGNRSSDTANRMLPLLFLGPGSSSSTAAGLGAAGLASAGLASASVATSVSLWKLGLFFLKVGALLYGSGYVLIAFLEGSLVGDLGWITQGQLLDAIAIGQLTPGPVLTTATFIGFLIRDWPGAIVATVAIFLPAFFLVGLLNPVIPRLRISPWASAFLDAVNAASVALMAAVTVQLGTVVLVSMEAWIVTALAGLLYFRFSISAVWLVVGGALLGYLLQIAG